MLELEWGRTRFQTEMVEFIALPFPSTKNLAVISRLSRAGTAKKCYSTKKRYVRVELLFC